MIPVGGKPLLEHTIDHLARQGIHEVVLNLHHLPDAIISHFGDGARWGMSFRYSQEDAILGTAGAVRRAAPHFSGPFVVWYGDNLSHCRLERMWALHSARGATLSLAVFEREHVEQSGIVGFDPLSGRIERFLEKPSPAAVFGRWVSAGIMILDTSIVAAIPRDRASDFGRDVLPDLLARGEPLFAHPLGPDEGLWWIDTPRDLEYVQAHWRAPR